RPAFCARDDRRRRCDGPSAVRAEMRPPDDRRAARAPRGRGRPPGRNSRREQRVELLEAVVECNELVAPLDQQVLAELVASVHLQHQPAEIAQALLANTPQRAPLAAELARMWQRPSSGTGTVGLRGRHPFFAAETCE